MRLEAVANFGTTTGSMALALLTFSQVFLALYPCKHRRLQVWSVASFDGLN